MSESIDAMIDAAFAAPTETPDVKQNTESEVPKEPVAEQEEAGKEEQKEPKDEEKRELTPEEKKLENALAYRKKQEARYRKEAETHRVQNEQLLKELAQYKPKDKPKDDGAPKESDYDNVLDWMDAKQDYKLAQAEKAREAKQQETHEQDSHRKIVAERTPNATAKHAEIAKSNPEILEELTSYKDVLDNIHPSLDRILLEAENPWLAAHHLAKEGVLDNLASMSLEDARVEFRLAQKMHSAPPKAQTKAPAPLPAARGSVASSKSLESMSGDELLKWINS